jgi:hypothetical protein
MSALSAGALSDANVQVLQHAGAQHLELDDLARRRPLE